MIATAERGCLVIATACFVVVEVALMAVVIAIACCVVVVGSLMAGIEFAVRRSWWRDGR